jgi:hypothetical protein
VHKSEKKEVCGQPTVEARARARDGSLSRWGALAEAVPIRRISRNLANQYLAVDWGDIIGHWGPRVADISDSLMGQR